MSESLRATSCLFLGCMSAESPMSMVTAMAVLSSDRASACAWRRAAHPDSGCTRLGLR